MGNAVSEAVKKKQDEEKRAEEIKKKLAEEKSQKEEKKEVSPSAALNTPVTIPAPVQKQQVQPVVTEPTPPAAVDTIPAAVDGTKIIPLPPTASGTPARTALKSQPPPAVIPVAPSLPASGTGAQVLQFEPEQAKTAPVNAPVMAAGKMGDMNAGVLDVNSMGRPAQNAPAAKAILESLYAPVLTPEQMREQVRSMGILDQAELNSQYNEDLDERNSFARKTAGGMAAGTVAGALLSKILNPGYTGDQAITTAMPALAGVNSAVGIARNEQEKADREYPTALRTYFNALTDFTNANRSAQRQNKSVNLEMWKAQNKGMNLKQVEITDAYGRKGYQNVDEQTGAKVGDVVWIGQTGNNPVAKKVEKVETNINSLRKLFSVITDDVDDEAAQQNKIVASMAATGDPEYIEKLLMIKDAAKGKSARLQAIKKLLAEYQANLYDLKSDLNTNADGKYEIDPQHYSTLKEVYPDEWKKRFEKPNGKFNPDKVGAPSQNGIYNVTKKK